MKSLKILEGFAGVGAFPMALKNKGVEFESTIIEWNIYSIIAYASIHENEKYKENKEINSRLTKGELVNYLNKNYTNDGLPILSRDGKKPLNNYNRLKLVDLVNLVSALQSVKNLGDISKVDTSELDDVELFWHSSPCQSFSAMGKNEGADKDSGTASSLMWESIRIISDIRPEIVIWENVSNVLSPKHIGNFDEYIEHLRALGYKSSYAKVSGTDVGWVQTRPRVFVYSYRSESNAIDLEDLLCNDYEIVDIEDVIDFTTDSEDFNLTASGKPSEASIYDANFESACINLDYKGYDLNNMNFIFDAGLSASRRAKATIGYCGTLLTSRRFAKYSKITHNPSFLTDFEYWKLMGFNHSDYDLVKTEIPKREIYKICGNSVLVPVIEEIINLKLALK